jgi:hypothetical protein
MLQRDACTCSPTSRRRLATSAPWVELLQHVHSGKIPFFDVPDTRLCRRKHPWIRRNRLLMNPSAKRSPSSPAICDACGTGEAVRTGSPFASASLDFYIQRSRPGRSDGIRQNQRTAVVASDDFCALKCGLTHLLGSGASSNALCSVSG